MSSLPIDYVGSTYIPRGRQAYPKVDPPSKNTRIIKVVQRQLPRETKQDRAVAALQRPPTLYEEIPSPMIRPPPRKPPLSGKVTPKEPAAPASAAVKWSPLHLRPEPPPAPLPIYRRTSIPGFPATYTGPMSRPGLGGSYPLTTNMEWKALYTPLGTDLPK